MIFVYFNFGLVGYFVEVIFKIYYLVRGGGILGLVLDMARWLDYWEFVIWLVLVGRDFLDRGFIFI